MAPYYFLMDQYVQRHLTNICYDF